LSNPWRNDSKDDCSTIWAGRLFQILIVSGKKNLWYIKVLANGILYLYLCPLTDVACGVKWVVGISTKPCTIRYFHSHMRIVEQINIISKWFHVFIQDRGACKHKQYSHCFFTYIFPWKILNTTIYALWLLKFVVFKWRSWKGGQKLVADLLYDFVSFFLV
jgi:hypothetical protein